MEVESKRKPKTIRIKEDIYQQARIAAVKNRQSLGHWLEKAIMEKVVRESDLNYREG